MDAIGHYWISIYSFLSQNNLTIHVINHTQTDGWRKGMKIRKRKTDIIYPILTSDFIRYGNFVETSLANENTMSLRNLSQFRNYLKISINDLKRKSVCILGEISNINRFSNASKLVSYARLDTSISQSGEYEISRNHMSKRSSPYLRKAIFQAAFVTSNNDHVF